MLYVAPSVPGGCDVLLSRPDLHAQDRLDAALTDEQLHCFRRQPIEKQVTLNFVRPIKALAPGDLIQAAGVEFLIADDLDIPTLIRLANHGNEALDNPFR